MEQDIKAGGVEHLATYVAGGDTMHVVSLYIHHTLTPERIAELTTLVESLALRAITTWAKL